MTQRAKRTQWRPHQAVAHILQDPPQGCDLSGFTEQELYDFFEGFLGTLPLSGPLTQEDRAEVRAVLHNWYMQQQFKRYLSGEAAR